MPLDGARVGKVGKEAKDGYERCNSGKNGGHCVKRDARGDEAQIISLDAQDDISADFEESQSDRFFPRLTDRAKTFSPDCS